MMPMTDPVRDSNGHVYQRAAILEWLSNNQTSPFTRASMTEADLADAPDVQHRVQEWRAATVQHWLDQDGRSPTPARNMHGHTPPEMKRDPKKKRVDDQHGVSQLKESLQPARLGESDGGTTSSAAGGGAAAGSVVTGSVARAVEPQPMLLQVIHGGMLRGASLPADLLPPNACSGHIMTGALMCGRGMIQAQRSISSP